MLNLISRTLEVRREPGPLPEAEGGPGYRALRIYIEEESVAPLILADKQIRVANLLPPRGAKTAGPRKSRRSRQS